MTSQWNTVRIFISSTFEDMHAERDYLVKQVFPELREWCERRRLHLVDIDLRWGVREEDAQNRNVVDVCLRRIDEARPFFLCFLGQRRGWVPGDADIRPSTLEPGAFPDLREAIGKASVTELEILHALVSPFHRSRAPHQGEAESFDPVKYAFFYLRDASWVDELPADFPELRKIYTNEGLGSPAEREHADGELKRWREVDLPRLCAERARPLRIYMAHWDAAASSPELLLPLASPSGTPENRERWRARWVAGGIDPGEAEAVIQNGSLLEKAQAHNRRRSTGRLAGLEVHGRPLSRIILEDLQAAITERYPGHSEASETGELQQELDQQEQFAALASQGFIRRPHDLDALENYTAGSTDQPFILTAPAGSGKSSLLAHWVQAQRGKPDGTPGTSLHFRFIGQSDRSTTVHSLLTSLARELKEIAGKLEGEIPADPQDLRREFPKMLESAGRKGRTVIVLDALNQLETGLKDLDWLPTALPAGVRLIVSLKSGDEAPAAFLARMQRKAVLAEVPPFSDAASRRALVQAYLEQYLKQLDEDLLETLVGLPGSTNPLYLKVVLSELRVFGEFARVGEKMRSDFGETPAAAFRGVLRRLEVDPAYSPIPPGSAVPLIFGALAHARVGLAVEEIAGLLEQELGVSIQAGRDAALLYLRQLRPFIALREGRYDFFFESFRIAALEAYAGGGAVGHKPQEWHAMLAGYFKTPPDGQDGVLGERRTAHRLHELAYQQAHARQSAGLAETLSDPAFLQDKLEMLSLAALLDDYTRALSMQAEGLLTMSGEDAETLQVLARALNLSAAALREDPSLLAGQLAGRLGGGSSGRIRTLLERLASRQRRAWLHPCTASLNTPGGAGVSSFSEHAGERGAAKIAAIRPQDGHVISYSDMRLLTWDSASARLSGSLTLTKMPQNISLSMDGSTLYIQNSGWGFSALDAISLRTLWTFEAASATCVAASGRRAISVLVQQGAQEKRISSWMLSERSIEHELIRWQTNPHYQSSSDLEITPDGHYAVLLNHAVDAKQGFTLIAWDLEKGNQLYTLPQDEFSQARETVGHQAGSDGKSLMITSRRGGLFIFDIPSGKMKLLADDPGHNWHCAISPRGRYAVSSKNIWDLETGTHTALESTSYVHPGRGLFNADESRFVVCDGGGYIIEWDIASGKRMRRFAAHSNAITSAFFLPDGRLATSSRDGDVRMWDLDADQDAPAAPTGEAGGKITELAVQRNARRILSTGGAGPVHAWNLVSFIEDFNLPAKYMAVISASGNIFVALQKIFSMRGNSWRLGIWDLCSGKLTASLEHTRVVTAMAVTPDDHTVLTLCHDKKLRAWDVPGGALRWEQGAEPLRGLVASPDAKTALAFASREELCLWDIRNGSKKKGFQSGRGFPLDGVRAAFSPGGESLLAVCNAGLSEFDVSSGKERLVVESKLPLRDAVFSPDGRRVHSVWDGCLRTWDLASGKLEAEVPGFKAILSGVPGHLELLLTTTGFDVCLWDPEVRQVRAHYIADGLIEKATAMYGKELMIVLGDALGRMHFLRLEGGSIGPAHAAARTGLTKDGRLVTGMDCPDCAGWSEVAKDAPGGSAVCSVCGMQVQLYPVVLDAGWAVGGG